MGTRSSSYAESFGEVRQHIITLPRDKRRYLKEAVFDFNECSDAKDRVSMPDILTLALDILAAEKIDFKKQRDSFNRIRFETVGKGASKVEKVKSNVRIALKKIWIIKSAVLDFNCWADAGRITEGDIVELAIDVLKKTGVDFKSHKHDLFIQLVRELQ